MEYTEYYQFRKPTKAVDIVKVGDINFNSDKIDELIHSTQVSLAPAYDATRTSENPYMTGDVVMKDALMYRCLEDDVYGAWDATKWERTTAGEEGAGGSDIEANPQGTPTDDLEKIGINGTIYNIAGSGGGGTALILDAQIYSTEEKVVGVWINEKPLYQKTFVSNVSLPSGTWVSTGDSILNGVAVDAEAINISTASDTIPVWCEIASDGHIELLNLRNAGTTTVTHYTVRYYKTTDTAGSGGYQAYGFSPIIYSTEEREVGVWKDNKPLYAKTVNITAYPSNTTAVDIPHGIADIDTVAHYETHARWASGAVVVVPNAQVNNGSIIDSASFDCTVNKTNITLRVGTNRSSVSGEITIWYTKTTDTAGSGSYNTLGVPMVHYSTTEHVIGTDESGNTIYEKTIPLSNLTNNAWNNIFIGSGCEAIGAEGYLWFDNNTTWRAPISFYRGSDNFCCYTMGNSSGTSLEYIAIYTMFNGVSRTDGKIRVRYTKSSS